MDKVTLITNKFCPFARKAAIALREKTTDFTLVDEDLQNKSEFFK
jgi:glutathione S-transferase